MANGNNAAFHSLTAEEQKRQIAIDELVSTEEAYMQDMSVVTEVNIFIFYLTHFYTFAKVLADFKKQYCLPFFKVFQKPMAESGVIKQEDIDTIFLNWKDLIACNNTFLRYRYYNVRYDRISLILTRISY